MISIGDIHVFVHDFDAALRFWTQGLGLEIVDKETTPASAYALLESPAAGPAIHELPLSAITPADQTLKEGYGNNADRAGEKRAANAPITIHGRKVPRSKRNEKEQTTF